MTVLMIILGILLIIGGGSCMFTPLMTFMSVGYYLMILLLVYGIMGIVRAISTKNYGLDFVFSILSVIAGIWSAIVPAMSLATDVILIYTMAFWFILQGIVSITASLKLKKASNSKKWIGILVIGILGILLGIYSLVHPLVLAFTMGILIGLYFIECGIDMILIAMQADKG